MKTLKIFSYYSPKQNNISLTEYNKQLREQNKQLIKDNKSKDKYIEKLQVSNECKDGIIDDGNTLIESKFEKIENSKESNKQLQEGIEHAKSNAGSTLGKLGHITT